jgi:Protein of unknown function (DUF2924)
MTTIAEQIAAIQKMAVPELVAEYTRRFGQAPHCRNRTWLWRNVAWKLQELHYGGLPPDAAARLEQIIDEHIRPRFEAATAGRKTREATDAIRPGTVLSREWHGRQVRVEVTDAGFVVDGVPYTSLSAAANAVTGQRWNGRLFWGLTKRKAKESVA